MNSDFIHRISDAPEFFLASNIQVRVPLWTTTGLRLNRSPSANVASTRDFLGQDHACTWVVARTKAGDTAHLGKALLLNISSEGILPLLDQKALMGNSLHSTIPPSPATARRVPLKCDGRQNYRSTQQSVIWWVSSRLRTFSLLFSSSVGTLTATFQASRCSDIRLLSFVMTASAPSSYGAGSSHSLRRIALKWRGVDILITDSTISTLTLDIKCACQYEYPPVP